MARVKNRFEAGSGMYQCRCCGRKTRSIGNGDNENVRLCVDCFDLAGFENMVSDGEVLTDAHKTDIRNMVAFLKTKADADVSCWDELLVVANA
jgi:hypothetical protein